MFIKPVSFFEPSFDFISCDSFFEISFGNGKKHFVVKAGSLRGVGVEFDLVRIKIKRGTMLKQFPDFFFAA